MLYISFIILFNSVNCIERISEAHSIQKHLVNNAIATGKWRLIGDSYIADGDIILTADRKSQSGGIWSILPVSFPEWEVEMEFQVKSKGTHLYGDGLVLWYAKEPYQQGNVFGYKDYFTGMGIFLDTYSNHNDLHSHSHPYVSLMVNDGKTHYDHDKDGTHTQAAGVEFPFRHSTLTAFIKVQYQNNILTDAGSIPLKKFSCFLEHNNIGLPPMLTSEQIHSQVSLIGTKCRQLWKRMSDDSWVEGFVAKEVYLPTGYFFGITAATGDLSDHTTGQSSHGVFYKVVKILIFSFFGIFVIFMTVWAIGYIYQERQRRHKRFY